VLVFELINGETRVPKGIAGLFLAGDISGRWRAQDFSTLSPSMVGRSPEKELRDQLQRLASEIQGKQAETERISAEIQSYDQVPHAQSVNVGAFFHRTGRPAFGAKWLAAAGLQRSKPETPASIKRSNCLKFDSAYEAVRYLTLSCDEASYSI
jgi:hypothetical protein